ncbi:Alpha/Beta hydrolase protein [Cyathus striatus]|nr:Alpha/Beta hydrolase protein [Cyathus striatus]
MGLLLIFLFTLLATGTTSQPQQPLRKNANPQGFTLPRLSTEEGYTGHINIDHRHTYFQFFESQNDPDKDDVIFWLSGPLGCSSSVGALMELGGPSPPDALPATIRNPHSLTTHANVFFIDQPIGFGFSAATCQGDMPPIYAIEGFSILVGTFFAHFTSFRGRPIHIGGASRTGRLVPMFTNEVNGVKFAFDEVGLEGAINLKSLIIGNGIMDLHSMIDSYYTLACTNVAIRAVLDAAHPFMPTTCENAYAFWYKPIRHKPNLQLRRTQRNLMLPDNQVRIHSFTNSIPFMRYITFEVSISLVCNESTLPGYTPSHSAQIHNNNTSSRQIATHIQPPLKTLSKLTSKKASKFSCTSEYVEFREDGPSYAWEVDGEKAGMVKTDGEVTFVVVEGTGHFVGLDRPREVMGMIGRWLREVDI